MDEYLVGELQCPVCLELLSWPIILPCSHVLCRDPCAERLFVHGFIRCPVSYWIGVARQAYANDNKRSK